MFAVPFYRSVAAGFFSDTRNSMGALCSKLCFGIIPEGPLDLLPVTTQLGEYDLALLAALRRSGRLLLLVCLWNLGDDVLYCVLARDPLGLVAGFAGSLPMIPQARAVLLIAKAAGGASMRDLQRARLLALMFSIVNVAKLFGAGYSRALACKLADGAWERASDRPRAASCFAPLFLVQVIGILAYAVVSVVQIQLLARLEWRWALNLVLERHGDKLEALGVVAPASAVVERARADVSSEAERDASGV